MRTNIVEDNTYLQLKEAWIANQPEIDEATAIADKEVVFTDADIVDVKGRGIKLHALVKGEDGQDAYIDLIVPNDYIRDENGKKRLSSKYVSRARSNFNKGLYATGGINLSTGYEADDANKPSIKLKDIKILSKDTQLPRYSKSGEATLDVKDQLAKSGVKIDPNGELKKALVTSGDGKPIIVNINESPNYLVSFEITDEDENTIRINPEGGKVITIVMPLPMDQVDTSGLINLDYVKGFVDDWNAGKRYVYDNATRSGHFEQQDNPKGNPLSVEELSSKLVDLDRTKPEFKAGKVGTGGDAEQRHRLQQTDKRLINDDDIEKQEKVVGRELTRQEFIAFVKGKGLITPEAFDPRNSAEKQKAILAKWLTNNPIIASYLKSRKRAKGGFAAGIGKHETPGEGKARMATAQDAEEFIIDDALFDELGIRDNIWASDSKEEPIEEPVEEPALVEQKIER